jgi:hypothetical protein
MNDMNNTTGGNMLQQKLLQEVGALPALKAAETNCTAAALYTMNVGQPRMLFGDIIPARGLWTLVGSSDTGKSMLLRQLALACVKGEAFLGLENKAEHGKVIFVSTEDDMAATSYLVKRQSPGMERLDNLRFCFDYGDVAQYLHTELSREPADLVIIDAWGDVYGKGLKDGALMRKALSVYAAIANQYSCSIGFLHHTHRRAERLEPGKHNIGSGQGYEAKMRLVIEFRADETDPALRHLCIIKGNYLGDDYKRSSYVLRFDQDSFTYSNTGARVPFVVLKPHSDKPFDAPRDTQFKNINDGVHRQLVTQVFGDRRMKYAEAYQGLSDAYATRLRESFGRDKSKQLLSYLVQNQFINTRGRAGAQLYEVNKYDE